MRKSLLTQSVKVARKCPRCQKWFPMRSVHLCSAASDPQGEALRHLVALPAPLFDAALRELLVLRFHRSQG